MWNSKVHKITLYCMRNNLKSKLQKVYQPVIFLFVWELVWDPRHTKSCSVVAISRKAPLSSKTFAVCLEQWVCIERSSWRRRVRTDCEIKRQFVQLVKHPIVFLKLIFTEFRRKFLQQSKPLAQPVKESDCSTHQTSYCFSEADFHWTEGKKCVAKQTTCTAGEIAKSRSFILSNTQLFFWSWF